MSETIESIKPNTESTAGCLPAALVVGALILIIVLALNQPKGHYVYTGNKVTCSRCSGKGRCKMFPLDVRKYWLTMPCPRCDKTGLEDEYYFVRDEP